MLRLPLRTLGSHVDFVSYTRSEGRYFPKDAYAGGMLKYPLRELDTDLAITTAITTCCKRCLIMDTMLAGCRTCPV
jgi:hypothetical protein